jgi:hypothetical protein
MANTDTPQHPTKRTPSLRLSLLGRQKPAREAHGSTAVAPASVVAFFERHKRVTDGHRLLKLGYRRLGLAQLPARERDKALEALSRKGGEPTDPNEALCWLQDQVRGVPPVRSLWDLQHDLFRLLGNVQGEGNIERVLRQARRFLATAPDWPADPQKD